MGECALKFMVWEVFGQAKRRRERSVLSREEETSCIASKILSVRNNPDFGDVLEDNQHCLKHELPPNLGQHAHRRPGRSEDPQPESWLLQSWLEPPRLFR